ncbi:hypothetical protein AOQ84DRAFT_75607 [Glonium stellatum]|uniref:Uncharacterized protein n=1 Tax=Glonium stellatum TaxID=574774 RepID=A0A8E2EXU0_9PEZI|nr:hypothetical protein AOQ84DRAFT_75607 [Glonium stellatum]
MAASGPVNVGRNAPYSVSSTPVVGQVISIILSMITIAALAVCLTRRVQSVCSWRRLPLSGWLLVFIYCDSFAFVFLTGVLSRGFDMNVLNICRGVILLCLACYMTTKVLIYLYLVEKAYIVRGRQQRRLKDKLYLFNFFAMICPYIGVFVLNFVFRFAYLDRNGMCIIGMKKVAMIPLISLEVVVNVYLTLLFVLPIRKLYSCRQNVNAALRAVALRTFIGSCATLTSSVVNITVLMVLEGEPGWICMMCCNADILFSVLVLHWVSSPDGNRLPHNPAVLPDINDLPFDGTAGGSMPPTLGLSFDLAQHKRAHIRDRGNGDMLSGSWSPGIEMQRQQHGHDRGQHGRKSSQHQRNPSSQSQGGHGRPTKKHQPCVTTHIAASRDADLLRKSMPSDTITVSTEQVQRVEIESDSEASAETRGITRQSAELEERSGSTDSIMGVGSTERILAVGEEK